MGVSDRLWWACVLSFLDLAGYLDFLWVGIIYCLCYVSRLFGAVCDLFGACWWFADFGGVGFDVTGEFGSFG